MRAPRDLSHTAAVDTHDRWSDRPTAQPWAARALTSSAVGRGLLMPVDRYEGKYGSLLRTGTNARPTVGNWLKPQGLHLAPRRRGMWAPLYPF